MGFLFTLLYIAAAYIAPQNLWGGLAELHIQIVIVMLAVLCSLPSLFKSGLLTIPQTYALLGLSFMIACSRAFNGWVGGAPLVLLEFVPNAIVFYLIVMNCRSKLRLQIVVAVLFLVSAFIIVQGWQAQADNNLLSPYLLSMKNDEGLYFYRLRGMDFLNDPNDLAQLFAGLIPCLFLVWKRGAVVRNLLLVYAPVAVLLFGTYLTHSRGGMLALLAMVVVLFRRRIGVLPAAIAGGFSFVVLSALGWSGGRDLSADAGTDRMDAWSTGLTLIKQHPVFGVGYLRFTDYHEITAHNTVVVCAAEIGLIGYFFWILFILPTARNIAMAARPKPEELPQESGDVSLMQFAPATGTALELSLPLVLPASGPHGARGGVDVAIDAGPDPSVFVLDEDDGGVSEAEGRRLSSVMLISLAGFLTPAWFLSRPYTMALFVEIGLALAVYNLANRHHAFPSPMQFGRALRMTAIVSVGLLLAVYAIVRTDHVLRIGN